MKSKNIRIIIQSTITFLVFLVVLFIIFALSYITEIDKRISITTESRVQEISKVELTIEKLVSTIATDTLLIRNNPGLENFLQKKDLENKDELEAEFASFIEVKDIYDQARFIDKDGMEVIRVDRAGDHQANIVTQDKLQDKSDRDYFQKAINLPEGRIYFSRLDLNIEEGEIEIPYKPTIRLATPVYQDGEVLGVVVLNYLAQNLLTDLRGLIVSVNGAIEIVDEKGYWLLSDKPERAWGFQIEDRQGEVYQRYYPEVWEEINSGSRGSTRDGRVFFSFGTINLNQFLEQENIDLITEEGAYWKIISSTDYNIASGRSLSVVSNLTYLGIPLVIIFALLSIYIGFSNVRRKDAENQIYVLNDSLRLLNKTLRHDILNNLTVTKYTLETFQELGKDQAITEIEKATKRSISMIDDMRTLEQTFEAGDRDRTYLISSLVEEIDDSFPEVTINLKGDGKVTVDSGFKSAIENLVRNAIMHGSADEISIEYSVEAKTKILKITDNGTGIPEEARPNLFTEGFKYGPTGNTGLGLYIVKRTIERYGGSITLEDSQSGGAKFEIRIPSK